MSPSEDPAQPGRLTDPEAIEDPYHLYRELIESPANARQEPGLGVLVWRYSELVALASDTATFSSAIAGADGPRHMGVSDEPLSSEVETLLEEYHPMDNALFTADPPEHTRHRALVNKALSPRRVRVLEPAMREIATELVRPIREAGRCELLGDFAIPLPLTVISDTLGVEREDMGPFKYWSDMMIAGNLDMLDNDRRATVARAVIDFQRYMLPRIAERREQPRDDLLSDLANAQVDDPAIEGPRKLSDAELLPIISQLLLAGNETTTNLIGNGLVLLIERPELMEEVRADHSLIPAFVEEVLRFDSPIHCTFRRSTEQTDIDGVPVDDGEMVVPMWACAGRDPEVFEQPTDFDLRRPNSRRHLSFGRGPHFCAGSEMARLEARVAFETLLSALDEIRIAPGVTLRHNPSFSARGYTEIPLELEAAPGWPSADAQA